MAERVLVTGGSGFVGAHCILQLLAAGHPVRATIRNLKREPEVRAMLRSAGATRADEVEFAAADLEKDAGWAEAVAGCERVLHVASPFPAESPKHEDELIVPAREGALRVMRAARDAGVRRVVLTSSFAAIGYGHPIRPAPFTEEDWTNLDGRAVSAYAKSKTLAERAAWEFAAKEGQGLELAVVNPVGVFGPVLGPDLSTSILLVKRLLSGAMPGSPPLFFGIVDVRDVADLHLRCMTDPAAAGQRFLAVSGDFLRIREIADILRSRLGPAGAKIPTRELPAWLVRIVGLWDPSVRALAPELNHAKNATGEKARRVLGWNPRPPDEALLATAESLIALGLAS